MSNVINQNLDEIISIKNQLSNVLIENGVEAGNRFSDYPDMFRSVIASGGSFNPSYYYTADEIDENFVSYSYATANYVSYSYLSEALEDIDVDVDLDDYVTYTYAYNTFVSYAYLGDLEQISEYILGSGSSSAPENVYATKTELGAYVSKIELSTLSYATEQYVDDEISNIDLPVINESLIPKETGTYTLGDSTHLYDATYTTGLYFRNNNNSLYSAGQYTIGCKVNGTLRYSFMAGSIKPEQSNVDLGTSAAKWANTYTSNLYAPIVTLSYSYNSIENVSNTRINFKVNQNNRCKLTNVEFAPVVNNGINLGSSTENFNKAYIGTIFLNGANLEDRFTYLIWTGTSAQYAALDNYTTYQIYMIEKDVN